MNWITDFWRILQDAAQFLGAAGFLIAVAIIVVGAVVMTASPEHRSRHERLEDESGDTHTNWQLHRVDMPRRPLQPSTTPAPRRRVRAGGPVLTPSYDSRKHATPAAAPDSFRT